MACGEKLETEDGRWMIRPRKHIVKSFLWISRSCCIFKYIPNVDFPPCASHSVPWCGKVQRLALLWQHAVHRNSRLWYTFGSTDSNEVLGETSFEAIFSAVSTNSTFCFLYLDGNRIHNYHDGKLHTGSQLSKTVTVPVFPPVISSSILVTSLSWPPAKLLFHGLRFSDGNGEPWRCGAGLSARSPP